MANFAETFRAEIARLARKEFKAEITAMRKTAAAQRGEISTLRRELRSLAQAVKKTARPAPRPVAAERGLASTARFSAKGLASQRKRLGLSAAQLAQLVDASAQSVYNWESGTSQPGVRHRAALLEIRRLGKRAVAARLAGPSK